IDMGHDDVLDDYVVTDSISGVTYLNVNNNSISDLTGIEDFTALTTLKCQDNQLTNLNLSNNTALSTLHCRRNQLTSIDLSNNLLLVDCDLSQNDLVSIDLEANASLFSIGLDNNELTAVTGLNNKPDLENVYLRNVAHWAGGNNAFTSLDVSGCPSLTNLYLGRGSLSSLDVTGCTSMSTLDVSWNELSTIDLSTLDTLRYYNGAENQLTSLDLSNNEELRELYIDDNELTNLDLSNNHLLKHLEFADNQLTNIDLSNNLLLIELFAIRNDLVSIDLAANDSLVSVSLSNNALTTVTGVNNKPNLEGFYVSNLAHWGGYNNITSLDLSGCPSLTAMSCLNNQMTYLNMRNGVTEQLTYFDASGNPDLTCIETLDPDYATENWTYENENIDEGVTFSVICGAEDQGDWYVATTGSDINGSGTQESPFATIQTGINAASNGNTVHVAAGTYVEHISYSGKSISIHGEDRESTIVDADTSGRAFYFEGFDQHTIAFSGFTITNGESGHGAGIYIKNSIVINLFDLNVNENSSTGSGAGGGIHIHDSMGELHNMRIENNEAYSGGGIYMGNSDIILDDVNVLNNNGRNRCGGTGFGSDQFDESTAEWYNSVFSGNTGLYQGSAMCMGDSVILSNLTITQNTAYNSALTGYGNWTIVNSIISDNLISANVEADAEINFNGTLNMSYTNLSGEINAFNLTEESELILGEGNIDADPLFCEPDSGNYHLAGNSPSAGTGEDGADMGALGVG
ncbi:MAG: hypothetical protein QF535_10245, partial [Anaerolineales bacterium]|nr:hypothetical protein [Anaerolineales bacterium]